ncbi:MAG: nucleoside 2-deoxyribosyltransferase domain-containing protein [Theionarchaea archaeon]|nr:nucleoside 2-deoxyribosyltransferase domain-containing protein [Theionarchaea archaeon]
MRFLRVYLAAPMFSEAELDYNKKVASFIRELGFSVFLPQEEGFKLSELVEKRSRREAHETIFKKDWEEVRNCNILVFLVDGRVPDEGGCIELGGAFAYEKECVGLKTDPRSLIKGEDNPMIMGCLKFRLAKNLDELSFYLKEIRTRLEGKQDEKGKIDIFFGD